MATNVAVDSILDGIVGKLTTTLVPTAGNPVTTARPAYFAQRYTGAEFSIEEGFKRGGAGRTPALFVRHVGSKSIKTSVSRRVDRIESTFAVVVCTDAPTEKDRRSSIFALAESVRHVIGARAFSLPQGGMRYQGTTTLRDSDAMLALAVTFSTKHRVDYTVDPGTDVIASATGTIFGGDFSLFCTLETAGTAGSTAYGYRVDGIDADGNRYEGQACRITTGNATLSATNYVAISWEAVDGMASYEIVRTETDGTPATTGTIGATALLTLHDTGLATTSALLTDPYTQAVEVDLT